MFLGIDEGDARRLILLNFISPVLEQHLCNNVYMKRRWKQGSTTNGDPEDAADIESTLVRPLSVSF